MKKYSVNKIDGVSPDSTGHVILSSTSYHVVQTYSEMLSLILSDRLSIIRVIVDENKGIENTIYYVYPDGLRVWVAATVDN